MEVLMEGEIKEIIVYTNGDSRSLRTWSNVPYLLTTTLEKKGVKVHRIDISTDPFYASKFDRTIRIFWNKIFPGNRFDYLRSKLHEVITKKKIKQANKEFPEAQIHFFISFSLSARGISSKPSIQFCDWNFEYYIEHFLKRKPYWIERFTVRRDRRHSEASSAVVTLFPAVEEYLKRKGLNNVRYLGNVINAVEEPKESDILDLKLESERILFIGRSEYLDGAKTLIKTFEKLSASRPKLQLDIIGMVDDHFEGLPERVTCHGYLDKSVAEQKERYYQLLRSAKLFVNVNPRWSAFSAAIEAMYFYTPIIVPPHEDFQKTFGPNFNGGCYFRQGDDLTQNIEMVLNSKDYLAMSKNAHNIVKDLTWDTYVDRLMELMDTTIS